MVYSDKRSPVQAIGTTYTLLLTGASQKIPQLGIRKVRYEIGCCRWMKHECAVSPRRVSF